MNKERTLDPDDIIDDFDDTLTEDELAERLMRESVDDLNGTLEDITMCFSPGFLTRERAE